jgi:hypothetical protein
MKTRLLVFCLFSLLVVLGGCSSNFVLPQATGWVYEVVVVADQKVWDGEGGEALVAELEADIPGLPQPEAALKLTKVTPDVFDGMLRYAKNIMQVNVDPASYTRVSLRHEVNLWAQNQVMLTLSAPDQASVVQYLKDRKGVVVDFFTRAEMDRVFHTLEKTYSSLVMEKVQAKFDVKLNVPAEMNFYKDTTDFFWASNNANTGRVDFIVYSFPYVDSQTFTVNYLVNKRDSVLRENLPGSFPNSYLATELRWGVDYTPITHLGKYGGVMRGLWKTVGDMMGGPFVSLTKVDEVNNRIVVVESFVFAPEMEKRNLMRRGEACLYTLRLPGEFDIPVSESLTSKGKDMLNNQVDGE